MMRAWLILVFGLLTACSGGQKAVAPVGQYGYHLRGHTSQSHRPSVYRVKKGDTLYSISWRYGLDYQTLARMNHIRPPYRIYVGQKLVLRASSSTVQRNAHRTVTKKVTRTKKSATKKLVSHKKKPRYKQNANRALRWRWPTKGMIISTYSKSEAGRKGIDIAGKPGQKIVASADGKVVYSGNGLPRYGNLLIIKHNDTYLSAYAHNQKLLVKEGQYVKAGQTIALLGKTGAQRYQLHFEIRRHGKPVDPMRFLPRK